MFYSLFYDSLIITRATHSSFDQIIEFLSSGRLKMAHAAPFLPPLIALCAATVSSIAGGVGASRGATLNTNHSAHCNSLGIAGDAVTFHTLWTLAGAVGLIPLSRLRKAVLYASLVPLANMPLMLYRSWDDVRRFRSWGLLVAVAAAATTPLGARLLLSVDVLFIKRVAGIVFLFFGVVQLMPARLMGEGAAVVRKADSPAKPSIEVVLSLAEVNGVDAAVAEVHAGASSVVQRGRPIGGGYGALDIERPASVSAESAGGRSDARGSEAAVPPALTIITGAAALEGDGVAGAAGLRSSDPAALAAAVPPPAPLSPPLWLGTFPVVSTRFSPPACAAVLVAGGLVSGLLGGMLGTSERRGGEGRV